MRSVIRMVPGTKMMMRSLGSSLMVSVSGNGLACSFEGLGLHLRLR